MSMLIRFALIAVAVAGLLTACSTVPALQEHYEELDAGVVPVSGEPWSRQEVERFFNQQFKRFFRESTLKSLELRDVTLLFQAAELASAAGVSFTISDMELALAELQERNRVRPEELVWMHEAYVRERLFDKANQLQSRHPLHSMERVPQLVSKADQGVGPRILRPYAGGERLLLEELDLLDRPLVVLWHPSCHFSQSALDHIGKDAILANVFKRRAVLLLPPRDRLMLDEITSWSKANPGYQIGIAYDEVDWPFVSSWQTPVFYVFENARLIGSVVGWPAGGQIEKLRSLVTSADKGRR